MVGKDEKKVAAARARAQSLTPEQRKKIAQKAAANRWAGDAPRATHESTITLGDLVIECAVLEDGRRMISERAMTRAFGGKRGGSHWKRAKEGGANLPVYLSAKNFSSIISSDLASALSEPIKYRTESGAIANGLDAMLLPQVCDVFLKARDQGKLHPKQVPMSTQADIIMRGLATVGIIALIDEATGYQRDRASDALAKILEKFIAKELLPWVQTFPSEYYEHLFRLRGLDYQRDTVKRPQYFGHLTNDIIYKRLAPGVREELDKTVPKTPSGRRKHQMHRRLTPDMGHPKLREHLASVTTIMKLSDDYQQFKRSLDRIHPRYDDTLQMDFGPQPQDDGTGL